MALFQTNVRFLGHNIERGSISPINRTPFIKDLAKDTTIIYDRLKKNPKAWSNDHTEAIKRIKEKEKSVETDVSDIGYGGVLTQYCPILSGDLYNQKFLIKTDCQAAKFMFNKDCKHDVSKQMFARWQALLAPFDFEIQYKKGEDNNKMALLPWERKRRASNPRKRGHILAQQGNRTLTSFNVSHSTASSSGTSEIDTNHPMYKEFMDFMKSKKAVDNSPPSYSSVLIDDENIEVFDMNDKKEVILLLEESDLKWRNEPWQIMARYLDTVSYTATVYKYRMHYEMILSSTGCEFQHFYPANTKKVYNFSKLIIKRIIAPEEWDMSTLKEMDYIHPEQKVAVKYNYWDYIEGFNKVLLYENTNRKHSWFIKICSNIFDRHVPNWFCKWWTLCGPSIKILPESYKKLYLEWVDISPKLIKLQEENIFFKNVGHVLLYGVLNPMDYEMVEFIILEGFPCLQRMLIPSFGVIEESSPFTKIARKLQMKKGLISKSEAIAIYMEEVKKDLMKNLDIDIRDDISMISASHTNEDEDAYVGGDCLGGERQPDDEEDLETILKRYQQQLEESSSASTAGKGKEKVPNYRNCEIRCEMVSEPWTFSNYSSYSSTQFSFMNIIKRRSTVKNSRKEEYDIPQHLDLLNKWTIPKISPRIIYQMGTFEKLGLKQVVKTTEETITIDSDNQTFRLLSDNDLAPYKDIYRFMHIGLVQDENSLSSLMLNVKLHGYDYMPGTEVVCICYTIYYKLLHTLNPMCKIIDFKNETILIETNFDKSKVVTRRPIKWEEIDFPQEWVIENATQPQNNINTEVSKIEQLNDGTVKIRFHDPSNMLIDNRSMSSRISGSNFSYISPVDYIVQVPSRASTSQIRETYRCDNIKIDRDNIVKPIRRNSSDLDITESEMNFPDGITVIAQRHVNAIIKQNNYANIYMSILGEHIMSLYEKVDRLLTLLPTKLKGKEKVTHSSLQPPPDIKDFKIKDYSDLESFLEKKFKGGGVQPLDTDNFIEGEPSSKKDFYDSFNKISEKYARKPVQRMFYYPRPTP
ncbi:hypothetical protein H5410_042905 [Solanum commersonii]|uniref:Uncharacterized protein n=1 Tax=Solanum commersonii TaxID=4109 RepID=A0A9J5XXP5_SOLCO|nr:hypothetical protein H5410_042905 [Solanum commersonii]